MLFERFDQLLEAVGSNQRQFAIALGVSQGYMSEVASGKKNPSDKILFMISQKFNIRMEWLKEGTGEIFKDESITSTKAQILNLIEQASDEQLVAVMAFLKYLTDQK